MSHLENRSTPLCSYRLSNHKLVNDFVFYPHVYKSSIFDIDDSISGVGGVGGASGIATHTSDNNSTTNNTHASDIHPSSAPSGTNLRKMISRHSSRSLVMSRSQLERGKLLELCLSVLGCSAQWHLQLLANR